MFSLYWDLEEYFKRCSQRESTSTSSIRSNLFAVLKCGRRERDVSREITAISVAKYVQKRFGVHATKTLTKLEGSHQSLNFALLIKQKSSDSWLRKTDFAQCCATKNLDSNWRVGFCDLFESCLEFPTSKRYIGVFSHPLSFTNFPSGGRPQLLRAPLKSACPSLPFGAPIKSYSSIKFFGKKF